MGLPTPNNSVVYNGFDIGPANQCELDSASACYGMSVGPSGGDFSIDFLVTLDPANRTGDKATDEAAFAALVIAVTGYGSPLRVPYKKLQTKLGASPVETFDGGAVPQTAYGMYPTVRKAENRRDGNLVRWFTFSVQLSLPANWNAFFEKNATSDFMYPIVERRTLDFKDTFTMGGGVSAESNYKTNRASVFGGRAASEANLSGCVWTNAGDTFEIDQQNFECIGRRIYQETLNGQSEAYGMRVTVLGARRVWILRATYIASSPGAGDAETLHDADVDVFAAAHFPTPIFGGEWVLYRREKDPKADNFGKCSSVSIFWEVVAGLYNYYTRVTRDESQKKTLELSGTYTKTASATALANYTAGIVALRGLVLSGAGGGFDGTSLAVGTGEGPDLGAELYPFSDRFVEILYPQSLGATDDPHVTIDDLNIDLEEFGTGRTIVARLGEPIPLAEAHVEYAAAIDHTIGGKLDDLWITLYKPNAINAVRTQLAAASAVLTQERHWLDLSASKIRAVMRFTVRQADIVYVNIHEKVSQKDGTTLEPQAEGPDNLYWPSYGPGHIGLQRIAIIQYVEGISEKPKLFQPGDKTSGGTSFTNTGIAAEAALTGQRNRTRDLSAPLWWCHYLDGDSTPTSEGKALEGDHVNLITAWRVEIWTWGRIVQPDDWGTLPAGSTPVPDPSLGF